MSHASKSHDAIDRIMEIRDHVEALAEEAERQKAKLDAERTLMETRLALADANALLGKLHRQSTVTVGDRASISGVRKRLENVMKGLAA